MCIRICTCIHICICISKYTSTCTCTCICIHIHICIHIYIYTHTYIHIYTYIHTYVYIHAASQDMIYLQQAFRHLNAALPPDARQTYTPHTSSLSLGFTIRCESSSSILTGSHRRVFIDKGLSLSLSVSLLASLSLSLSLSLSRSLFLSSIARASTEC